MSCTCQRQRTAASFRPPRRLRVASSSAARTAAPAGGLAGVVTTVKNFAALAESWCTYHLSIGFAHLYIYFDDPAELDGLGLASRFPSDRLTAVPHDSRLRKEWARLPHRAAELVPHAACEVQTRQQLNARHAMHLAVARGLDWLLHIDADELFYPGPSMSAPEHFAELSRRGAATFCYMNYEAVPEAHGVRDPFREVSLFKRSLEVIARTAEAREAVDFWAARQSGSFFYYYDNGKAAARVLAETTPLSVHEWLPGSADGMRRWYSNMRECWQGRGNLGEVVRTLDSPARILHYPCYNEQILWVRWKRGNDNYRLKGREEPPPLHARVCTAAQAAFGRAGDAGARAEVRRCFEAMVMLCDEEEVDFQLRVGVCERIEAVARLLRRGED